MDPEDIDTELRIRKGKARESSSTSTTTIVDPVPRKFRKLSSNWPDLDSQLMYDGSWDTHAVTGDAFGLGDEAQDRHIRDDSSTSSLSIARPIAAHPDIISYAMREDKVYDVDSFVVNCKSTPVTIYLLNGIAAGSTSTTRIGRVINLKSVFIRGILYPHADSQGSLWSRTDLYVVYDRQPNGVAMVITDFLKISSSLELPVLANQSRFVTVLHRYWVNGGYLFDGGTCCADTSRKFVQMVTEYLAPTITKEKLKISKDDILEFVTLFVNLKVSDPLYDSQAKTRFKGPSQKTLIDKIFDEQFKLFVKKNPKYFDTLLTTIRNKSNKRAIQQFDKKVKLQYIEGYLKATAKDRTNTWLLINEGLSAASSVVTAPLKNFC